MSTPLLFTPLNVGPVEARNRLWVSPICQWMAGPDGLANSWHLANYGAYAAGGAGLIVVESTAVAPEGRIAVGDLGLWNDAQATALRPLVDLIKRSGAVAAIQLGHSGRKGNATSHWGNWAPDRWPAAKGGTWQVVGPSPIANDGLDMPQELTGPEIGAIVEAFAGAAARAVAVGFDTVEIHGAHGYLLHQFMSATANQRSDYFGGSFSNRTRLVLAVVGAVREAIGPDKGLMIRLSATEWIDGGWDLAQTLKLVPLLVEAGVDHIDVSSGGLNNPPVPVGPGYQVALAAAVRQACSATVNAVGLITSATQAEQILVAGQADSVMAARAWMRNPHLAAAWARDLGADLHNVIAAPYSPAYLRS